MKKSFILSLFMLVAFGLGLSVPITAEHLKLETPLWATIASIVLMIAGATGAGLSLDKDTPHKNCLRTIFCMFGTMGVFYALWRGQIIPKDIAQYCNLGVLIIGMGLMTWFSVKDNTNDKNHADETTQPLHDVDDNDVTVVSGEEAVVVEDDSIEFPQRATLLVLDENGNPELDEDGKLQFYDDEGHRIYGVSALGTVTKITDDSIVITKEDGSTITVNCDGSVEGDIPASLYVPHPNNKEGWRNVYQGVRERLEERPDEDK